MLHWRKSTIYFKLKNWVNAPHPYLIPGFRWFPRSGRSPTLICLWWSWYRLWLLLRGGRLGATFASPGREKIEIDKEYGKPDQEKRYIISIEGCEGIRLVLRERSKRNCGVRIRKWATKEAKDHVENNPKSSEEGNRPSSSVGEVETTTGARSGSIGLKDAKDNDTNDRVPEGQRGTESYQSNSIS